MYLYVGYRGTKILFTACATEVNTSHQVVWAIWALADAKITANQTSVLYLISLSL